MSEKREYIVHVAFIVRAEYPQKAGSKIALELKKEMEKWEKLGVRTFSTRGVERNFI